MVPNHGRPTAGWCVPKAAAITESDELISTVESRITQSEFGLDPRSSETQRRNLVRYGTESHRQATLTAIAVPDSRYDAVFDSVTSITCPTGERAVAEVAQRC